MCPGFGNDAAACSPLENVITYCRRGVQPFFDVACLEQMAGLIRMVTPDAGQAVSLELEPDTQFVGFRFTHLLLPGGYLVRDTEQILDMVAYFVSDHVSLGKIARRPETLVKLTKERQIEIDFRVPGTVERTCGGRAESARRAHAVREKNKPRLLITAAHSSEYFVPGVFRAAEHDSHKLAHFVVLAGRPVSLTGPALRLRLLDLI
jgi:hypothetical protein